MVIDYELNDLKREFLGEAAEKVGEIRTVLDGGLDAAALERLAYLAHQLKGSGGSYGYQRISENAQQIESAVEQMMQPDGGDGLEASIKQHVLSLQTEIDQRQRELSPEA